MTGWANGIPDEYGFDRYGESPYYNPEGAGLEVLAEHDWAGDYEFSQVVVWRHRETGELRAAADSGCSCPTPFGDLTWEGMKPIGEPDDLRSLVESLGVRWDGVDEGVADLKAKVHRALREVTA
jgi:hypothetical protein